MTWLKLDDRWNRRPDILALSDGAHRLHLAAMTHSMDLATDSVVARRVVAMLTPTYRRPLIDELTEAGLWRDHPEGWFITDPVMLDQPIRAEVEAERMATKARVALSRARSAKPPAPAQEQEALGRAVAEATRAVAAAKRLRPEVRAGATPVTPSVTPAVTALPTDYAQRPDPTRPGVSTTLSGTAARAGVAPPSRPPDEAAAPRSADELRAVVADPKTTPWDRKAAEATLQRMGVDVAPVPA